MIKKVLILFTLINLIGCGRVSIHKYTAYDDKNISDNKFSVLHVTRYNYVKEIDGKGEYSPDHVSDMFPYTGANIKLLPGKHALLLKYQSTVITSDDYAQVIYTFSPNKEYFLYSTIEYIKSPPNGFKPVVSFHIGECGTKDEKKYNEKQSERDSWLDPFVTACNDK